MDLIQKVQAYAQEKHGKVVILGVLAVAFSIVSIGIVKLASSAHDGGPPKRKTPPIEVSSDPKLKLGGEMSEEEESSFKSRYGAVGQAYRASEDRKECDNRFPDSGFSFLYRAQWDKSPAPKTELEIENLTSKPLWLRLMHPTADYPIIGYLVYPMQKVARRVNIGLYGVDFSQGTQWCNIQTGMVNSKTYGLATATKMSEAHSVMLRITEDDRGMLDSVVLQLPRRSISEGTTDALVDKTRQRDR